MNDGKCMVCGEYYIDGETGGEGLCNACWAATEAKADELTHGDWPEEGV